MAERTISVPKGEPSRRLKEERRVCVRFPTREELGCRLAAACPIEQPSSIWFGRLRDIARTGAALLLTRPFEEGNELVIELSDPANADPRYFLVHVAYSRREGRLGWLVGCEFISPLSKQELQALVGE
jgi:hypothetical protein